MTTYLLIAVGALVRASGAGLGCPDWPQCFGLWVPPVSPEGLPPGFDPAQFNVFKTWTEYINRLLGALTGLLILATLVLAIRDHRRSGPVLPATAAAFVLVLFNGWLGGVVVKSGLAPLVLTGHLVFALVVVSLLLYATVSAFFPDGPIREAERTRLGLMTLGAVGALLVQVGFGAFLRGEIQEVSEGLPRSEWLQHVGLIEPLHESFAIVAGALVIGVSLWAALENDRWLRRVGLSSVVLLLIQAFAGWGLEAWAFPRVLQVAHLWAASLLLGTLTLQAMLAWRIDPRLSALSSDESS